MLKKQVGKCRYAVKRDELWNSHMCVVDMCCVVQLVVRFQKLDGM